jgi:hypothetical protein
MIIYHMGDHITELAESLVKLEARWPSNTEHSTPALDFARSFSPSPQLVSARVYS